MIPPDFIFTCILLGLSFSLIFMARLFKSFNVVNDILQTSDEITEILEILNSCEDGKLDDDKYREVINIAIKTTNTIEGNVSKRPEIKSWINHHIKSRTLWRITRKMGINRNLERLEREYEKGFTMGLFKTNDN